MTCLVCSGFDRAASTIAPKIVICSSCRKDRELLHEALHIGNLTTMFDLERKRQMKLMYELYMLPLRDMETKGVDIKVALSEVKENLKIVGERITNARKELTAHARN